MAYLEHMVMRDILPNGVNWLFSVIHSHIDIDQTFSTTLVSLDNNNAIIVEDFYSVS